LVLRGVPAGLLYAHLELVELPLAVCEIADDVWLLLSWQGALDGRAILTSVRTAA
jgi:hypothetical protein